MPPLNNTQTDIVSLGHHNIEPETEPFAPEQPPTITNNLNISTVAFENLYTAIVNSLSDHEDNPQLLLFIAVLLNDVPKVQEAVEVHNADAGKVITPRNRLILSQMGVPI